MVRQTTRFRRRELFDDALAVIEEGYADEDLSLASVAHRIATSPRQLQRAFAEAGGTSFRRELQRVRMRRAAELLRDGTRPVQDVAASVGYRHGAQFAKAFRRHHGVAPSSLRGSPGQLAA